MPHQLILLGAVANIGIDDIVRLPTDRNTNCYPPRPSPAGKLPHLLLELPGVIRFAIPDRIGHPQSLLERLVQDLVVREARLAGYSPKVRPMSVLDVLKASLVVSSTAKVRATGMPPK